MFSPVFLKDCVLQVTVGEAEPQTFEAEVSAVKFTPSTTKTTWKGLTSMSRHSAVSSEWGLDITVGQDHDTATSLSRFLHEHEGETVEVLFRQRADGVGYTSDVTLAPGDIGGQVETHNEASVSMPCTRPVLAAAPEPEPEPEPEP